MSKPTLRKGPASSYEAPNEVIREFGNGKGDGGLLSLRNMDDGSMVVEVYQVTGPVKIHTPSVPTGDLAEEARKIITGWNRGLITLSEMVTGLQKLSDVRDRELLQAGAEIAAEPRS